MPIDKFWPVKEVTAKKSPTLNKTNIIMSIILMFLFIQASKISSSTPYSKIF
jgi:hypothetical protein